MFKEKFTVRDMCFIGIFTAVTVIMAQISIPMPMGVPITMQTFAICLAGMLLSPRNSFFSALLYVLLGAIGIPVFAQFSGGLGIVFGPTGGFILSFPIMAWLVALGAEKKGAIPVTLGLVAGILVNFVAGMVLFSLITGNGLGVAFTACVLPFIPTTIIKTVAAGIIGARIKKQAPTLLAAR
ncbi:biotin transporter BioY [Clostridia bacterium]|nr:biotin transporter BioY [Clostridia bacterium]